uniref:Uncharacterized protein n=1 Tax=Timema monikensis TaxID=170555 RepID=A0A7R9HP72_9NEOP|nr:unnamed protein product [Timema monikensis]
MSWCVSSVPSDGEKPRQPCYVKVKLIALKMNVLTNFSSVVKKWWVDAKGLVEAMAPAGIGLGTPGFEHHWRIKSKVPDLIPMLMIPGSLPGSQNESNGFMMMAMCWVALALAIFFLRPNTLRAIDDSKPRNNGPVWPKRGSPYTSTGNKLNEMTVDTSRL